MKGFDRFDRLESRVVQAELRRSSRLLLACSSASDKPLGLILHHLADQFLPQLLRSQRDLNNWIFR